MTAFRDAIAAQAWHHSTTNQQPPSASAQTLADAIQAMPEMQWILELLRDLDDQDGGELSLTTFQYRLIWGGCPESVRAWVEGQ